MISEVFISSSKPLKYHSTKTPTSPSRRVGISEEPIINIYDVEQGLCETHEAEDPCNRQMGCNWNGDKCLPSSEVISREDKLLNKILLASYGYYDGKEDKLDLKNTEKVSRFIKTEDETRALIKVIDDKDPVIVSMRNRVFGPPEEVEVKMKELKETLKSGLDSGLINDADDAF